MSSQKTLFEGNPKNDKARLAGQAFSVLQSNLRQEIITTQRRATRRLERALAACIATKVMSMGDAIQTLVKAVRL